MLYNKYGNHELMRNNEASSCGQNFHGNNEPMRNNTAI